MRTLTLEELGRELGEKEWTLESKHEYEAAILIEMEKATGFYEEDCEELTFTAGNRLRDGLGSLRITKPMVYGITEQDGIYTMTFTDSIDDIEITEWEPLPVQQNKTVDVEEFFKVLEDAKKKSAEYFLHLNAGGLDNVDLSDAYFTDWRTLGALLTFCNSNRKPIDFKKDGTPIYSFDSDMSFFIKKGEISYIEETTETEADDWFTLPVHRMFHIHMKEVGGRGNVVTVGIFYNN